jgi:hypothetical protein
VQGSDISRLLSTDCKEPVNWTTVEELDASPKIGIYVCDGETDSDQEVAARKFVQSTSFPFVASQGKASTVSFTRTLDRA